MSEARQEGRIEAQREIISMFDDIASSYDITNRVISLGSDISWRKEAIASALSFSEGCSVIADVATGTGDMILFHKEHRPDAHYYAIDPSYEMLEVARKKLGGASAVRSGVEADVEIHPTSGIEVGVERRVDSTANAQAGIERKMDSTAEVELEMDSTAQPGIESKMDSTNPSAPGSVEFIHTDACHLTLQDGSIDMLSIAYGLRNVLDFEGAMAEFSRVLKVGGVLLIVEFMKQERKGLFYHLASIYTSHILPVLGGLLSRNYGAYKYLPKSIEGFVCMEELAEIASTYGLELMEVTEYMGGISSSIIFKKTKVIQDDVLVCGMSHEF